MTVGLHILKQTLQLPCVASQLLEVVNPKARIDAATYCGVGEKRLNCVEVETKFATDVIW